MCNETNWSNSLAGLLVHANYSYFECYFYINTYFSCKHLLQCNCLWLSVVQFDSDNGSTSIISPSIHH